MNFYVKAIRKELNECLNNQESISITDKDYYIDLIKKAVDAIDDLDAENIGEYSRGRADGMEDMAKILSGGKIR